MIKLPCWPTAACFFIYVLLPGSVLASRLEIKSGFFSVTAQVFTQDSRPYNPVPAFSFSGTSLLVEDLDGLEFPQAHITIRRTTYACDDIDYTTEAGYSCILYHQQFLKLLEEVATHQQGYSAALATMKKYFDAAPINESIAIPFGHLEQQEETETFTLLSDPDNSDNIVELKLRTSGLIPP